MAVLKGPHIKQYSQVALIDISHNMYCTFAKITERKC